MRLALSYRGNRVLPAIAALTPHLGRDCAVDVVNAARGRGVTIEAPEDKLKKIVVAIVEHCDPTSFSYLMPAPEVQPAEITIQ